MTTTELNGYRITVSEVYSPAFWSWYELPEHELEGVTELLNDEGPHHAWHSRFTYSCGGITDLKGIGFATRKAAFQYYLIQKGLKPIGKSYVMLEKIK